MIHLYPLAIKHVAKIFEEKWSSLNPKENRLVFYLDNLGLTWALQKESFHDHQSIELFSTLKNITNRFKTLFLWHPRDTEAAKLADYMSKIPEVQFTENISSFYVTIKHTSIYHCL